MSNKVNTSAVVNNLTTSSAGYVLDARQGKALNDGKVATSAIVNNATTTAAGHVLDGRMGKTLNDAIGGKVSTSAIANNLTTTASGNVLDARQGKTLNDNLWSMIKVVTTNSQVSAAAVAAGAAGYVTTTAGIPSGYKTTGIVSIGCGHPGAANGLQLTCGVATAQTGSVTFNVSYYAPKAISAGYSDFTLQILCVKSGYSLT